MVFLTLQKTYKIDEPYCRTIAVQKCGGYPYELTLRFAQCCLHCGACFASGYSWPEKFRHNKRVRSNIAVEQIVDEFTNIQYPKEHRSYNWLRILGGEPLLNDEYIDFLFNVLIKISSMDSKKFNDGIVIQTNGIHMGKGHLENLKQGLTRLYNVNPNVIVAIETSIKGSNPDEFMLIAQQNTPDGFYWNIKSYFNLKALNLPNLRPTVIAGYGINESFLLRKGLTSDRISIVSLEGKPIYHPSLWSKEFEGLYNDFTNTYQGLDPMFSKMPMYGLKDQYQYPWAKNALKQGRQVFGNRWYDAKFINTRDLTFEKMFFDILDKFFLVDNQKYYSTLISKS